MNESTIPEIELPLGATGQLQARIVGWNDEPLVPGDISSVGWKLYHYKEAQRQLIEVPGYAEEEVDPEDIIHELRAWDEDDVGYNFTHTPPNRNVDFADIMSIGETYRLNYYLTPSNSEEQIIVIAIQFRIV